MRINPEALQVIRERSGLTQAGMSRLLRSRGVEISDGYYRNVENGAKHPAPDKIKAIAAALDVPLGSIIGLVPPTDIPVDVVAEPVP